MSLTRRDLIGGGMSALAGIVAGRILAPLVYGSDDLEESQEDNQEENLTEQERLMAYARYIAPFEGREPRTYDARPNDPDVYEPTIGVGHYLGRGDSRETFRKVFGNAVDWDAIYQKRASLTDEQIDRLFAHDIPTYVDRARALLPNFDNLPLYLQEALVNMAYRGDLVESPKTIKLLNQGKFREAAVEYTKSREYKTCEQKGMSGIKPRMDSNRARILRYAEELRRN